MENPKPHTENLSSLLSAKEWLVAESGFDSSKINFYETIFTIGNGYLGTRGALEDGHRAALPGTYINGLFDHFDSTVVDLINAPDWLPVVVWVEGGQLDMQNCEILDHERMLDLRKGFLFRHTRVKDKTGRITQYESLRYASFSDQHLCEMRVHITPENYSGKIQIESYLNGNMFNLDRFPKYTDIPEFKPEVKWEKWAKSKHLYDYNTAIIENGIYLESRTRDRHHTIGYASSIVADGAEKQPKNSYDQAIEHLQLPVREGETLRLEKLVTIFTSRELQGSIQETCTDSLAHHLTKTTERRLMDHVEVWEDKWNQCDIVIDGDEKANHAVRFNIYHLLIGANPFDSRANIGAKSLSGEGYKGHVFWDTEIFTLPFYIYTQPKTAKALLMYRYHTLGGARENAHAGGYKGARYAWESADTGLEETPRWTHDGEERIWTGEEEIHITSDVMFGFLTYHTATNDMDVYLNCTSEILFETARFWVSRLAYDKEKDRYELKKVIGPDEFHEHVDNSVFTNWLVKWHLQQSIACYNYMEENHRNKLNLLQAQLSLTRTEVEEWGDRAGKVFIPFDRQKKIIEQFAGYFATKDVPITEWDANNMPIYPNGLDHFSCNDTSLIKQPDVVMLMYILPDEFSNEIKKLNYEYYEARTMHKSSLSPCIHTIMGIETGNTEKALQYFERSAYVDLIDNQGNTQDGIHIASAGGTWQAVVNGFGGMRIKNRQIHFNPWLPEHWKRVQFKIKWKGDDLYVIISKSDVQLLWQTAEKGTLQVVVRDNLCDLLPNDRHTFAYK